MKPYMCLLTNKGFTWYISKHVNNMNDLVETWLSLIDCLITNMHLYIGDTKFHIMNLNTTTIKYEILSILQFLIQQLNNTNFVDCYCYENDSFIDDNFVDELTDTQKSKIKNIIKFIHDNPNYHNYNFAKFILNNFLTHIKHPKNYNNITLDNITD